MQNQISLNNQKFLAMFTRNKANLGGAMRLILIFVSFLLFGCGDIEFEIDHEKRTWESETYVPRTVSDDKTFLFCPNSRTVDGVSYENNSVVKVTTSPSGSKSASVEKFVVVNDYVTDYRDPPKSSKIKRFFGSMSLSESGNMYEEKKGSKLLNESCYTNVYPKRVTIETSATLHREPLYVSFDSNKESDIIGLSDYEKKTLTQQGLRSRYPLTCEYLDSQYRYIRQDFDDYTYCIVMPDAESYAEEWGAAKKAAQRRADAQLKYQINLDKKIAEEMKKKREDEERENAEKFGV